ncbi:hypothetical protein HXX76_016166 [Chlamydomonas incerta]|uniref:Uncharacterized protein n=1 Tax=Chlamydomonas incerta TaxID=51695 RepID=A0A835SAZ2_CHLIN|nr:hypothetical protein HXX76_016231 [Chlamydomonas incerta]KAG2422190.1 hypothetical protein HXX76_016221 [Chlamydomonas incerta]KAG2422266.1 hypothetical protein HXX76_016166 [Chlamydomonas incerta]|eukprot:KAG2422182.1 hypothetical protein HXX76_016231 [Chlamydomonas incerta]
MLVATTKDVHIASAGRSGALLPCVRLFRAVNGARARPGYVVTPWIVESRKWVLAVVNLRNAAGAPLVPAVVFLDPCRAEVGGKRGAWTQLAGRH